MAIAWRDDSGGDCIDLDPGHNWQRLKTADDDNQPHATFVLWGCPCGATQMTEHPINDPAEPVKETTEYVIPEAALKGPDHR